MKTVLSVILSILLFFTRGCGPEHPQPPDICTVVTEISIDYKNGPEVIQRRYTDQRKMRKVLLSLRALVPWDAAVAEPENMEDPNCKIQVTLSDGTVRHYEQNALRYLRVDNGPWKVVRPERSLRIPLLIAAMESDNE